MDNKTCDYFRRKNSWNPTFCTLCRNRNKLCKFKKLALAAKEHKEIAESEREFKFDERREMIHASMMETEAEIYEQI